MRFIKILVCKHDISKGSYRFQKKNSRSFPRRLKKQNNYIFNDNSKVKYQILCSKKYTLSFIVLYIDCIPTLFRVFCSEKENTTENYGIISQNIEIIGA